MKDIIQIYKREGVFNPHNYTPENRKKFHDSKFLLESESGFIENHTLVLPIACKNEPDLNKSSLVIIQDTVGLKSILTDKKEVKLSEYIVQSELDYLKSASKEYYLLKQLRILNSFEFFKVRKIDTDKYELFIDYASNASCIGIPERRNHKICDLEESKPIRYRINGKSDFTLGGSGKERTFYEFDYIIEWIGKSDKLEFRELNKIKNLKSIPFENCKTIDERKILR